MKISDKELEFLIGAANNQFIQEVNSFRETIEAGNPETIPTNKEVASLMISGISANIYGGLIKRYQRSLEKEVTLFFGAKEIDSKLSAINEVLNELQIKWSEKR